MSERKHRKAAFTQTTQLPLLTGEHVRYSVWELALRTYDIDMHSPVVTISANRRRTLSELPCQVLDRATACFENSARPNVIALVDGGASSPRTREIQITFGPQS